MFRAIGLKNVTHQAEVFYKKANFGGRAAVFRPVTSATKTDMLGRARGENFLEGIRL